MKSSQQYAVLPIIALSLSAVVLSACNGSSNDTTDTADSGGETPPENKVSLLVAADGGDETGLISRYDASIQPATGLGSAVQTFAAGLAEGIATDHADHLYQAGIDGFGTVKAVCHLPKRASGSVFDVGIDRVVTSALNSPKGITVAQKAGLIMTAETGAPAAAVSVVSATAGEGSMPLYTISRTAMGGSGAWDVAYDEDSDKLFVALTNGSVAYFKGYLALAMTGAEVEPTAIFRPNNPLPASNMHGIVYDAASDRLIVSDVGSATSADDGSLYVFEGASGLSGAVAPERTLRGAATLLGNPVDLSMQNGALFVAEKANGGGRILVFLDIAGGGSGDIAPDRVYDLAAPESLMASAATGNATMVTPALSRLLVSANAANMGTQVTAVSPALDTKGNVFTPVMTSQFVESIANRIIKNRYHFSSFTQFCAQNKSRDITYTRMNRILLHLILQMTQTDVKQYKETDYIPYLRILGFRKDSAVLLSALKKSAKVPVISKLSSALRTLDGTANQMLKQDIFSSELYEQQKTGKTKNRFSCPECSKEIIRV